MAPLDDVIERYVRKMDASLFKEWKNKFSQVKTTLARHGIKVTTADETYERMKEVLMEAVERPETFVTTTDGRAIVEELEKAGIGQSSWFQRSKEWAWNKLPSWGKTVMMYTWTGDQSAAYIEWFHNLLVSEGVQMTVYLVEVFRNLSRSTTDPRLEEFLVPAISQCNSSKNKTGCANAVRDLCVHIPANYNPGPEAQEYFLILKSLCEKKLIRVPRN